MTADQIIFQAQPGSPGGIATIATSLDQTDARDWHGVLSPFLSVGGPLGRGYLEFGSRSAAIRWSGDPGSSLAWQYAHAYVGSRSDVTAARALGLPELKPDTISGGALAKVTLPTSDSGYQAIAARVGLAEVTPVLADLLGHVLNRGSRVVMPWQEPWLPEAALWSVIRILDILREPGPLSFLSYASLNVSHNTLPGTFVSFQPGALPPPPDVGYFQLATFLAERFVESPGELRQQVAEQGIDLGADRAGGITRLLALLPTAHPKTPVAQMPTVSRPDAQVVVCPICLGDITDWNTLSPWEWDFAQGKYAELVVPPRLTELQRAPYLRNAYIRCTAQQEAGQPDDSPHYLPAQYGRFGRPVVLGFVGLPMAGKSHLLSAMVAGIVGGELRKGYHISHAPLDQARHQTFLDDYVTPLLKEDRVLPGTAEADVLEFADAFVMSGQSGLPRPVAFFDIAGGDLASLRKKRATDFLWMADGLFFVVDPERLDGPWVDDKTFSNVLDIIRERPRPELVSAAIVLAKADTLRFEEPVTRWLRYEPELEPLNATQFLRESADVYGYLESRNALALAAPYDKCARATLHVASATGGPGEENNTVYSRGVRPRRVIRPLAAMLAMTGVLAGAEAEKVGI